MKKTLISSQLYCQKFCNQLSEVGIEYIKGIWGNYIRVYFRRLIPIEKKKELKRVGTHNGRFHADEVMATAILKEIFDIELIRTRDEAKLKELDIVYDVGGGKFDHHDTFKECREDGIPFASCGLIWREFGRRVIRFMDPSIEEEEVEAAFTYVDKFLIKGIDALDNGVKIGEKDVPLMDISRIISGFNPQWFSERDDDEAFNEAVELASVVLDNVLKSRMAVLRSREIVQSAYEKRNYKEILVLELYCPYAESLRAIDKKSEVVYVVYPSKGNYAMQTVRDRGSDKKPFPESWAGKRDKALVEVTGVEDSVFCHSGRFLCIARSYDGIMKLAKLAIGKPHRTFSFFNCIKMLFKRE